MSEIGQKFLEAKWRRFAKTIDMDGDGYMSMEDHIAFANRCIEVRGIDPQSTLAVQIRRKLCQTFTDLYGNINNGEPVSYDQIIKSFTENPYELWRLQAQDWHIVFDAIDINGDGFVQPKEFRLFFNGILRQSIEDADKVFNWIDLDKDGKLDLKEFIVFGEKFFMMSTDEDHPSKHFFGILSDHDY